MISKQTTNLSAMMMAMGMMNMMMCSSDILLSTGK